MNSSLENVYGSHHASRRGAGFVLLGDERGSFLKAAVGTGKNVLDIGCRDGALTRSFAEGNIVLGLDIDSEALSRAHSDAGIETRQVDLNGDWGVGPGSFDVVVAAEIVEHLYYPEVVFAKAAAALGKGGLFVGTVPNAFSLKNRFRLFFMRKKGTPLEDPTHINHFTVNELRRALAKHFAEVEVMGYGRHAWLAKIFPQAFAFGLKWKARVA